MKIAYFTDNLDLTQEEAEKFWPLYNKHEQQKSELSGKRRMRSRKFSEEAEQLSEEEAEQIIDRQIEIRQEELKLDMEFHNDLKQILPAKKIMNLYITEIRFREHMLRQISEDRGDSNRRHEREFP